MDIWNKYKKSKGGGDRKLFWKESEMEELADVTCVCFREREWVRIFSEEEELQIDLHQKGDWAFGQILHVASDEKWQPKNALQFFQLA